MSLLPLLRTDHDDLLAGFRPHLPRRFAQLELSDCNVLFDSVDLQLRTKKKRTTVFHGMSAILPKGRRLAIFGNKGEGKTTLVQLIAGIQTPTRGHVYRDRSISWPLGFSGFLESKLSPRDNAVFMAGIYDLNVARTLDLVYWLSAVGKGFDEPLRKLRSSERGRFGLAVCFAMGFDCYLVDNAMPVMNKGFAPDILEAIQAHILNKDLIFVTSNPRQAALWCESAGVIENKRIVFYDDFEEAASKVKPVSVDRAEDEVEDDEESEAEELI